MIGSRGFCPVKLKAYAEQRSIEVVSTRPDWINASLAGRLACNCGIEPRIPRDLAKLDRVVEKCPRYEARTQNEIASEQTLVDDTADTLLEYYSDKNPFADLYHERPPQELDGF